MRLKNLNSQIPGGFRYRMSAINWDSVKTLGLHPSFSTLVTAVMSARAANPHHAAKHKWRLDRPGVEHDVEQYNVKLCQANNWSKYLADSGGGGAPFPSSQSLPDQKQLAAAVGVVRKLWSGIKSVNQWLDDNHPPVSSELSEKRAQVCVACPMNGKGDFTKWFTVPASAVVTKQLQRLQDRKISTSQDANLNICETCLCPLKLVVHVPLEIKLAHMDAATKQELHPSCWILSEEKAA